MKTTFSSTAIVLVTLAGLLGAREARADQHQAIHEIERLALHVRNHSREMATEVRRGRFPHSFSQHLLSDLAAIGQSADHLRDTADDHDHPQHVLADIRQLSPLVRQAVSHVRELNASFGWHGGSASLRNLTRLAAAMQQDMREIEASSLVFNRIHSHGGNPGWNSGNQYRPAPTQQRPGFSYGPGGLTFGNSRFSIQLGR